MNKREFWWRFGLPAAVMLGGLLLGLGAGILLDKIELRQAGEAQTLPAEAPADGIGRITAARYLGGVRTAMPERAARIAPEHYTEGEGPEPEWWMPDEPMAAEWEESNARQSDSNAVQRTDAGCPDYNVDYTLYGWDGRTMEAWEMDLFSRIVFLEFGISSQECREAGIDAILRLWESEYYSSTLFGTVSAVAENGKPAFSTYPGVWEAEYDYEKLAQIREDCEERFVNGPEWIAPFFRTEHYHDWAVPCYEIDGVYFSTGKGWQ